MKKWDKVYNMQHDLALKFAKTPPFSVHLREYRRCKTSTKIIA